MLPFGSDSTMLSPRYLTIVRGNYLVCFMAWAIVPWKIESSAAVFTKFLSGYGIFMYVDHLSKHHGMILI